MKVCLRKNETTVDQCQQECFIFFLWKRAMIIKYTFIVPSDFREDNTIIVKFQPCMSLALHDNIVSTVVQQDTFDFISLPFFELRIKLVLTFLCSKDELPCAIFSSFFGLNEDFCRPGGHNRIFSPSGKAAGRTTVQGKVLLMIGRFLLLREN